MRKLILSVAALAAFAFAPLCAQAQTFSRGQTGAVGAVVTATDTSGDSVKVVLPAMTPVTAAGVEKGTSTSPMVTSGNVASGTTDSGNPVKTACVYNSTLPTYTTGQRADCQAGSRGSLHTELWSSDAATPIASTTGADGASLNGVTGLIVTPRTALYNGATWDRAFTCGSSAVVSVTAAATTQIVALSASTQVRVCSIALTMSAAGTAKLVYGTGSNCGTGTTDLTGAMALGATTPMAVSAPSGGSLLRTAAGTALCVTAVTGNVTGFITYAQY